MPANQPTSDDQLKYSRPAVRAKDVAIVVSVVVSAALAIGIAYACSWLGGGSFMRWVEYGTNEWIQHRLAAHPVSRDVPIMILDISGIKIAPVQGAQHDEEATPRDKLQDILNNLASFHPLGIGVDIDFSPQETYRTPQDPGFFDFCEKLENQSGVPIFLGVFQGQQRPKDQWLLDREYGNLGASILAPKFETDSMLQCFQARPGGDCGPSMSQALANQIKPQPSGLMERYPEIFKRISLKHLSQNVSLGTISVDYGTLDLLMSRDHTIVDSDDIPHYASSISNSVVLLGDVASPSGDDKFPVPGHGLIPGVYIHAAAIYTLSMAPLYELTGPARFMWDVITFSIPVIIILLIKERHILDEKYPDANLHHISLGWTVCIAVFMLVVCLAFVYKTRLLWPDFLFGIALSFVELQFERPIIEAAERVSKNVLYRTEPCIPKEAK